MTALNLTQQTAVNHTKGPLLVLAGAGSGKTRVITTKIASMITNRDFMPEHIAAVTFTNKAAREMKVRVGQILPSDKTRGLRICTFHSLGLNIFRQELSRLGYKAGFSIFDTSDVTAILKELLGPHSSLSPEFFLYEISRHKNNGYSPDMAMVEAVSDGEAHIAEVYARYQKALRAYNAVDFDDLIRMPLELLEQDADCRAAWQYRIRYLMVDEYQDTNSAQYRMLKAITGTQGDFTVVGDDDQSIYAWRGAQPENLLLLKEDYPALELIKLEQNYRSCKRILKSANVLIANNPHLFDKKLWSDLPDGDPIRLVACRTAEDEATRVVSEIHAHRLKHGLKYKDYAILYRGNHQARLFESRLREHQIPYKLSGGTSFFERAEIKDIMGYFRLAANSDDDAAFLRVINTPRREIGTTTLEKLGEYANEREVSLLTACGELGLSTRLADNAREKLVRFAAWLEELSIQANAEPVVAAYRVLSDIDYEGWLQAQTKDPAVSRRRMENVHELLDWMSKLNKKDKLNSLADIISHMSLMDILEKQQEDDDFDGVSMMTLHASKGLEFKHVFLVGAEEELLPHYSAIEEDTIEEERRLAYVGITRAQTSLVITMARKRKRYGELQICEPSRFLAELPKEDIRWEGEGVQKNPEEQKAIGRSHLASLKDMLKD